MAARRTLADCTVTLGVTGSIAAYKAADIVRLLVKLGIDVRPVMTRAGAQLMSPHTLATLAGRPVLTDLFRDPGSAGGSIDHLDAGRDVDLMLIAPATANILGKVASGIADDLLSTAIQASAAPVLFAPAMNTRMWENPIVEGNVARLRQHGYAFVGPDRGDLACGETGAGRMVAPEAIVDRVAEMLLQASDAPTVLVTAGPTEEELDPVRVLTNRSSGVMGVRLAEAARDRGYRVTLLAGPLRCARPLGVRTVTVTTTEELRAAVVEEERRANLLIMAAAVTDYRAAERRTEKIPSGADALDLPLVANPDILASVAPGRARRGAITVGFALEIGAGGEERARAKLQAKQIDMIVLNDATRADSAFGGESINAALLFRDGRITRLGPRSKADAAVEILAQAEELQAVTGAGKRAQP
jgi:phosphopantothenoylcysteine decarboxylase/phosphopantothenate--cysteine ligase